MKLLINTTEELKQYLGFLDSDLRIEYLKAKLILATNEVIDLIGLATYNLAVAEYEKEIIEKEEFIFAVANPVAIQAYRKFAPHNDVSHTKKGRLNRLDEGEKSAFEWAIDNDNEALERSYYESLDGMIKYLDTSVEAWKQTDFYKSSHGLFVNNATDFDAIFPINKSRLLFLKLAPGIKKVQTAEIKARLGKELYDSLLADAQSGSSDNEELLLKIKDICVASSLAWAFRRFSAQLFPDGVAQNYISDRKSKRASKAPEQSENFIVARYFEQDALEYLSDLENLVADHKRQPSEEVAPITFNPDPNNSFISL